jgi:hypothetical protein
MIKDMAGGRPSTMTQEHIDHICNRIASSSDPLRVICQEINVPYVTVKQWLIKDEVFRTHFARAKDEQADHLAEEIISIADDSKSDTEIRYTADGEPYEVENKEWTSRSKLRVDARKWAASKLKPKKYGEKLDMTLEQKPLDLSILSEEEIATLASLQAKLNA